MSNTYNRLVAVDSSQNFSPLITSKIRDIVSSIASSKDDVASLINSAKAELSWIRPGELSIESDIYNLHPGAYVVPNTVVAEALGLPESYPGLIIYYPATAKGGLLEWQPLISTSPRYLKRKVNNLWSTSWGKSFEPPTPWLNPTPLSESDNLDTLPTGARIVTNRAVASALNLPSIRPGTVETFRVVNDAANQRFSAIEDKGQGTRVFTRDSIGGVYSSWREYAFKDEPVNLSDVVRRDMLKQGLSLRKGKIGTGGVGVVSLRFDDAPDDFTSKILPLLVERRLPFTRVTTSDSIGGTVVPESIFPTMQDYLINYGGEVFNHGRTHINVTGDLAIENEFIGALKKLRTLMPRVPIDCFSPPGGSVTYDGHMPSNTIANFSDTRLGRSLYANHALVTGYLNNSTYRHLDGVPRDGFQHRSCDTTPLSVMKSVTAHVANKGAGLVAMYHSNNIGATGYVSLADFTSYLDYLVAERSAGRVMILTVTGAVHADASTAYRSDFLSTHTSTGNFSETLVSHLQGFYGATVELTAEVKGASGEKVISAIGEVYLEHTIPSTGTLYLRHPVTIPLDIPSSITVSINKPASNVHLYTV